jgi:hypothetical protein
MATTTIKVGDHEVEFGWIAERGAYYATVLIRCLKPVGDVRDVGYVFKTRHSTQADALEEAEEMAHNCAKHPDHHRRGGWSVCRSPMKKDVAVARSMLQPAAMGDGEPDETEAEQREGAGFRNAESHIDYSAVRSTSGERIHPSEPSDAGPIATTERICRD